MKRVYAVCCFNVDIHKLLWQANQLFERNTQKSFFVRQCILMKKSNKTKCNIIHITYILEKHEMKKIITKGIICIKNYISRSSQSLHSLAYFIIFFCAHLKDHFKDQKIFFVTSSGQCIYFMVDARKGFRCMEHFALL